MKNLVHSEEFLNFRDRALAWKQTLPLKEREQPGCRFPHQSIRDLPNESKDFFDKLRTSNSVMIHSTSSSKSPDLALIRLVAHFVCGPAKWQHFQPACERSQRKAEALRSLQVSQVNQQSGLDKIRRNLKVVLEDVEKIEASKKLDAAYIDTLLRPESAEQKPEAESSGSGQGTCSSPPEPSMESLQCDYDQAHTELTGLMSKELELGRERRLTLKRCLRLCKQSLVAAKGMVRVLAKKAKLEKGESGVVSAKTKEEIKRAEGRRDDMDLLAARLTATLKADALAEKVEAGAEKQRRDQEKTAAREGAHTKRRRQNVRAVGEEPKRRNLGENLGENLVEKGDDLTEEE